MIVDRVNVEVIKLNQVIAEKEDFDNTVEVLMRCLEMLYFDARLRGGLSHEMTMEAMGDIFNMSSKVFLERYDKIKEATMSEKEEYAKVAKREKYFSTLAKKEGKGAAHRAKVEKGAAKKDSEWEEKVDREFAKKRAKKAKIAKRKESK